MIRDDCDQCGAHNVTGALFCESCRAYLGWELTSKVPVASNGVDAPPTAEWSTPTLVLASGPQVEAAGSAVRAGPEEQAVHAALGTREIELAPGSEPVHIDIAVQNKSEIVDAYAVDAPDAPAWLEARGGRVRLMPGTGGTVRLSLRIRDGILADAQRIEVPVRVQSEVDANCVSLLALVVRVAAVDHEIALRAEPSVIRVKDGQAGEFVLTADNSANNHPVQLRLSAQDPERVVGVVFATPTLDIPAGEMATVPVRVEAPLPDPGEETNRQLTISAFDGSRTAHAVVTFSQRASVPVADPPVALRLQPSLVSAIDAEAGELRLEIDNSNGRHGAHVELRGDDPEGSVRFEFSAGTVEVAPAAVAAVTVRVAAPRPEPGVETDRPFTITARHDRASVGASGTLRQRTSAAAISAIRLRVEPPSLRVHDATRGHMRVVADNRSGIRPVRVWLRGTDQEGTAQITFSAPHLDVPAGQQAAIDAEIRAPRPPAGTEHRREFTVTASDGQHEVAADGTFAQTASDRRPRLRTLFTVLGGLVMILGAFLPWTTDPDRRSGVQWTVPALTGLFNSPGPKLNSALARLACAGAVIIVLAVLAIWGRLGPKGRLTRLCALLGLCLIVGFLIFLHVRVGGSGPAIGAILVMLGCVSAYVGGQLARR